MLGGLWHIHFVKRVEMDWRRRVGSDYGGLRHNHFARWVVMDGLER